VFGYGYENTLCKLSKRPLLGIQKCARPEKNTPGGEKAPPYRQKARPRPQKTPPERKKRPRTAKSAPATAKSSPVAIKSPPGPQKARPDHKKHAQTGKSAPGEKKAPPAALAPSQPVTPRRLKAGRRQSSRSPSNEQPTNHHETRPHDPHPSLLPSGILLLDTETLTLACRKDATLHSLFIHAEQPPAPETMAAFHHPLLGYGCQGQPPVFVIQRDRQNTLLHPPDIHTLPGKKP
jgi:hypothetical protein